MQATVSQWRERDRRARVVLDDGRDLPVAADVVDRAGLVRLRPGQRVSVELVEEAGADTPEEPAGCYVTGLALLG